MYKKYTNLPDPDMNSNIAVEKAIKYRRSGGLGIAFSDVHHGYIHMEAGHVSQNIYLQVVSLGLGTVAVGAFHDEEVSRVLVLPEGQRPLT